MARRVGDQAMYDDTASDPGDDLDALLKTLTVDQLRFVLARMQSSTDSEAAEKIGYSKNTVSRWGEPVQRAVRLLALDGIHLAREVLRRALPRAAEVKVAGLSSRLEHIRQAAATEILDRELGKPMQRQEIGGFGGGAISVDIYTHALKQVYGSAGDSDDDSD